MFPRTSLARPDAGLLRRRSLLLAAPATAIAAFGATAMTSPARADENFPPEFLTAAEDFEGWDPAAPTDLQQQNARLIIAITKQAGISDRGAKIAIATAIVEGWLYNRNTITDGTSGGMFQQQTSQGWGTDAEVRNKALATRAFFGIADHTPNPGLLDIDGWESMGIGAAAQAVQRSEYPDRYELHAQEATSLYDTLAPGVPAFTD